MEDKKGSIFFLHNFLWIKSFLHKKILHFNNKKRKQLILMDH